MHSTRTIPARVLVCGAPDAEIRLHTKCLKELCCASGVTAHKCSEVCTCTCVLRLQTVIPLQVVRARSVRARSASPVSEVCSVHSRSKESWAEAEEEEGSPRLEGCPNLPAAALFHRKLFHHLLARLPRVCSGCGWFSLLPLLRSTTGQWCATALS